MIFIARRIRCWWPREKKTGDTVDGGTRVTTWKSEIPLAVAGFAYGDYKVTNDKAGDVVIDIYANREPDDVMTQVQRYFEEGRERNRLPLVRCRRPSWPRPMGAGDRERCARIFGVVWPFSLQAPFCHQSADQQILRTSLAGTPLSKLRFVS